MNILRSWADEIEPTMHKMGKNDIDDHWQCQDKLNIGDEDR